VEVNEVCPVVNADQAAECTPQTLRSVSPVLGQSVLLLVIFFASGFLSLLYQVVWSRLFYPVFGMNLPAVTAVVAAFMGGLGLGAHLFGRLTDRSNPWRLYAGLEVGLGLFGLLLPSLTRPVGILFASLTPLESPEALTHVVRFLGVTLLLLGPCLLMGGTFPAFVRGYSQTPGRLGKDLGSLYALNTLGAACGCFLTGVVLLPRFAMDQISYGAALGNFLLAITIWLRRPGFTRRKPAATESEQAAPSGAVALLTLLFLTGYVSLSFELLWIRALTQNLGATYFSFAMILTAMLLGITLGSALYRSFLAERERVTSLAVLTVLLFVASVASFLMVGQLDPLLQTLRAALPGGFLPPLVLSLVAFLPTATLFGAIFPLCLRQYAVRTGRLGQDLGSAYAINTVGAVTGVVLTGLVTSEHLGSGGSLLLLLILSVSVIVLAFRAASPPLPIPVLAAVVALAAAVLLFFPRDICFENQRACLAGKLPSPLTVLFRGEDASSMATLVELGQDPFSYVDGGEVRYGRHREIFHSNWRGVGGTRIYLWNVVSAYLAAMLHPEPTDILIIGYGSGRQLSTLVGLPSPQRIDVVEINRLNFSASDYFYVDTKRVLGDPRVTVYVDDGRNHLLRSRRSYDVILVDVGGISGDGSEFFYTREFLELCREHLEPGGLVFTWMHINRMLGPLGWMYQRTFQEVFPDTSIWLGSGEPTSYGWLWLVGSNAHLSIDFAEVERRWGRLAPGQLLELELAGLREPSSLLALHLVSLGDTLPERIATARILSDEHPYYKPIWESPHQSRAFFERGDVYEASLKHLLKTQPAPPLVNLSRDRRQSLEEERRRLRTMARKGMARGAFRLLLEPVN